ncbi:MAG: DNA repair protein RecO [Acidobacteriaceae bacterium]|nr:DNA repair protein RecO [Acidobacteriaceae bacterium]
MTTYQTEAIVLRTWPFEEADLLVSLFTREQGVVKGVARHAMRSRKRFGGALEPMTHVRATYAEKPKQDLVRLDSFEILWSPMSEPVDYGRVTALQFVAEVLGEALPERAVEDDVFRLTVATLAEIKVGQVWMPVTYFTLWMTRLMGWLPELSVCIVCGEALRGQPVWFAAGADGVTCGPHKRPGSVALAPEAVALAERMLRRPLAELLRESWGKTGPLTMVRRFAVEILERHLERQMRSARVLSRL